MKCRIAVCAVLLCLMPAATVWSAEGSSFDHVSAVYGEGFASGAVMYLPDFTGTGSRWEVLRVTCEDEIVRVKAEPVLLSAPSDTQSAVYTYEIRLEGAQAGDAFVWLELTKDGLASWRYVLYVIVDPSLDVKIQTAELMPAYGITSHMTVDHGASEHFTREEMDEAISVIRADFATQHTLFEGQEWALSGWIGYVLQEVHYTSDERSRDAFEYYGIRHEFRDSQGRPYVDGIVFESTFHTPMTDDGMTGLDWGGTLSRYGWTLLKTEDGEWEIVSTGF